MFVVMMIIMLVGFVFGSMNIWVWGFFVFFWMVFLYMLVCFSFWGGGFLIKNGVFDFFGGYVIYFFLGMVGFVVVYWVLYFFWYDVWIV